MKILTLEDLGNNLPIPDQTGTRHQFKFKPWKLPEEKKIGELKKTHKHLGRFVREVFDFMLVDFQGKAWQSVDLHERKLILSQLPWANVFYMWCYLRVDALGTDMKMERISCPQCEFEIKNYKADLNSLEVKCSGYDDDGKEVKEDREWVYKLKVPFTHGEVEVVGLKFGYTPWLAMEKIGAQERNFGSIKEAMIAASIIGALTEEGGDTPIQLDKQKVLENLAKKDIEGFYDELDEHNGGPILGLDVECPSCSHKFNQYLNWTYDYFFGSSSL